MGFVISLKITGLLTGLLTWGWKGALIGFFIGYLLDKKLADFQGQPEAPPGKRYRNKDEQLFFQLTFQMLGYLAKADGQVSQQEIHATEHIMSSMALTSDERLAAIEAFNLGKGQATPPEHLIRQFKRRFRNRTGKKLEWLHYQFQLLYAEGRANTNLIESLGMSAFYAGVSPEQFQTLRQQYRKAWQDNYRQQHGEGFSSGGSSNRQSREQGHQQGYQQEQNGSTYRSRSSGSANQGSSGHYRHQYQSRFNTQSNYGLELQAAYRLLGVSSDTAFSEIKKAYRKQMSRIHPDKLTGRNASPDAIQQAKEQAQQLQAAYQLIKSNHSAVG